MSYKSEWKRKLEMESRDKLILVLAGILFGLMFIATLYAIHENSVVATMIKLSMSTH